jgi:putative molybdopterin biosynthesis protein
VQGLVFRSGDARFAGRDARAALAAALQDPDCRMVNRNQGSGTRILIDLLVGAARPPGYASQPRNHQAVAAAVLQGRADWGLAIASVAQQPGLDFLPLQPEQYDFVVPIARRQRPAIVAFCRLLDEEEVRARLAALGMLLSPPPAPP